MREPCFFCVEGLPEVTMDYIIGHSPKQPSLKRYIDIVPASTTANITDLFPAFRCPTELPFPLMEECAILCIHVKILVRIPTEAACGFPSRVCCLF